MHIEHIDIQTMILPLVHLYVYLLFLVIFFFSHLTYNLTIYWRVN